MNAKIIQTPTPMEFSMWGMISSHSFTVEAPGGVINLTIHFQKLSCPKGQGFRTGSFEGYDITTGLKVRCLYYRLIPKVCCSGFNYEGSIIISKAKASDDELSKIYGPTGVRIRKIPLGKLLDRLQVR